MKNFIEDTVGRDKWKISEMFIANDKWKIREMFIANSNRL